MILITEFMDEAAVETLKHSFAVTYTPDLADRQDDIPAMMQAVQALIVRNRTQVTSDLLDMAPNLRVVGRLGVGLDNIDVAACDERGIEVIPATGANTLSVAEYVVTNALILLRNAYQAKPQMLSGEWPRAQCSGREVAGRTIGLIGYGANAQETAKLAVGLGMKIIAFDPMLPKAHPAWGIAEYSTMDDIIQNSDVVSLHVPLTDDTRHMIDANTIARMRQDAILINAARGGIVDERALADALHNGKLSGAALDVFETEPLTQEAAEKFQNLPNLILTPHIAGVTKDSNIRVSAMIAEEVSKRLNDV